MTDKLTSLSPGKIIDLILRMFGYMLGFMGAICVLSAGIDLFRGKDDYLSGLISGAVMLAISVGALKLGKRAGLAVDERLSRFGVNFGAGDTKPLDENSEVYREKFDTYRGTVEHVEVRKKPVDEKGKPVDSYAVQRAYRISDRDRFIVGRNRNMIQFFLGVIFWIIAFFYSNGYKAILGQGRWEFDFLSLIMVLVGIIFTFIGGLDDHVEIDKHEGWVKRDRAWVFIPFIRRYPLSQFDHVLIKRSDSEIVASLNSDASADDEIHYKVCLSGSEFLALYTFSSFFDARDLAQKVAGYTGFPVKDDF
ncbi:membrane hypothetical protein [uncultured Desulfobacterium sp.]|uniref:Uncharacterized protein n=1 Tax=uncultured Desulfobacterium sp. TaxID=201089 RepID=A0A445N2N1_9BACT|nr:membrane hypothetical protein [uncultured Desulfobacterium sp.]